MLEAACCIEGRSADITLQIDCMMQGLQGDRKGRPYISLAGDKHLICGSWGR